MSSIKREKGKEIFQGPVVIDFLEIQYMKNLRMIHRTHKAPNKSNNNKKTFKYNIVEFKNSTKTTFLVSRKRGLHTKEQ